jgi:HK97 gp10 family phage protein
MELKVEVLGLKGLEDALTQAGPKLARACLRKGLTAGGQLFVDAAKQRAPVMHEATPRRQPGELRDAIAMKVTLSAKQESGTARIGLIYDKAKGNQSAGVWGSFIEFGSVHGAAQPYMRPGYEGTKNDALEVFAETLREALPSLAKK